MRRIAPRVEVLVERGEHGIELAPRRAELVLERLGQRVLVGHVDHDAVDQDAAVGPPPRTRALADPAHLPVQAPDPVLHLARLAASLVGHALVVARAIGVQHP